MNTVYKCETPYIVGYTVYDDGSLAGGLSTGTLLTMSFAVARARPTTHVTATVGDRATLSGVVRPPTTRTTVADSRRDRRRLSATERRREVRSRHHTRAASNHASPVSAVSPVQPTHLVTSLHPAHHNTSIIIIIIIIITVGF